MNFEPHILRPVGDATPKPPIKELSRADKIQTRAIRDAERSFGESPPNPINRVCSMAINPDDLQDRLCAQLCAAIRVERRPDGQLMLATEFEFPDGDRYPIYLSEVAGGVRLSDRGDTLMRISYDHDIDAFVSGSRGLLIERILGEERVSQDHGVFYLDTPTDRLSDAVFRYGRALTRIYDLTLHSRSRSVSTFYDDLADLIFQTADEEQIQRDHTLPEIPN